MKKLLALLLVTTMLVAFTGCGFLDKAKDIKEGLDDIGNIFDELEDLPGFIDDDDDEDDAKPIVSGDVYFPESYTDLLAKYSEFGFEHTTVDEAGASIIFSFHFVHEGTEEVDGVDTEVFTVTKVENNETEVNKQWFDEEWQIVKVLKGEEILDEWYGIPVGMFGQIYVLNLLNSQMVVDADGYLEEMYKLEEKGTESGSLGQMETYKISSFLRTIQIHGYMDVDGEKTIVLIRKGVEGSKASEEMLVTHLVAR